ncbi:MAG: TraB/GumN family protein [Chloroflexota bacterium]|nr:TraB/GumN family protein [Chloroflexota bacterium]
MTKRISSIVIALFLALALLTGCSDSDGNDNPQKSFLWEVPSDSGTVYILGSIHMASQDLYPLNNTIEEAFNRSQYLVVEVDITNINQSEMLQLTEEYGMYPQGNTLKSALPVDLYEQVKARLQKLGIPIDLVQSFKPGLIAMTIEELQMSKYGYKPEYGIDMHFIDKANESDMDILELESARFQMEMLGGFSEEIQLLMIEDTIENTPTEEECQELYEVWGRGDIDAMERLTFESLEGNPDMAPLYEKMIDDRNSQMAIKIEGYLAESETYFVVVGAGHLVGENGIIDLLIDSGYEPAQL